METAIVKENERPDLGAGAGGNAYAAIVVALTFLVMLVSAVDRFIFGILMPSIKLDLGLSDSNLGLLSSLPFAICYSLISLPAAWLADTRFRRTSIVSLALTVWSGMTAMCGLASGYLSLFLLRMGVGAGEGAGNATALSVVTDSVSDQWRRRGVALSALGATMGGALAFLIGGWAVEQIGWRLTFVLVGVPGILMALLYKFIVREPARTHSAGAVKVSSADLRELLQSKAFIFLLLGGGFATIPTVSLSAWMPTYMIRTFGMNAAEAGSTMASIFLVTGLIGGILAAWIGDKLALLNRRWPLWMCGLMSIVASPALLGIFLVEDRWIGFALLSLSYLLLFSKLPLMTVAAQDIAPKFRTTAIASFTVVAALIGALGPWMVGAISDSLSALDGYEPLRMGLLAIGPAALFAAICFWVAAHYFQPASHASAA